MGEFDSIDEILEFAIAREVEANEFYQTLAGKVENPAMAELISEFAKDELGHKAKLELELMKRGTVVGEAERAREAKELDDFSIGDYIVDTGEPLHMEYEDLLLLGMKKEKASFRLYMELAAIVKDEESRETLVSLAEEEARHKVQMEIDYDDLTVRGSGQ
ncbi:MAG: ferritin family protein [Planctomycetota bacterium]|jgi:rubrerythrin